MTGWAVRYHRYGGPEVLRRDEVGMPTPRADEVSVRVSAVGVHRLDLVYRSGTLRLHGLGFPKGTGFDFLGVVEGVGSRVDDTATGDVVWGCLGLEPLRRRGTLAERITVTADQYAVLPVATAAPELASLPLGGLTALACLRDRLAVGQGDRVLVVGAGGGVGTAALQVARILGADPVAVCGHDNVATCRELGAEEVYDYTRTSPADLTGPFDAILDAHGADVLSYRRLLRPGGRVVATAGDAWIRALPGALRRPRVSVLSAGPSRADLAWLATELGAGRLRPVVDSIYPVRRVAEAHRDAESPHAHGRRVVAC